MRPALARIVLVLLAGLVLATTPLVAGGQGRDAAKAERRLALIIGNARYPTSPLRNPVNDARAMGKSLQAAGFEVLVRENLSQKEMRRAIIDFGEKLREGDVGLFYFAGHGLQVAGRNYMVPVDAEIASEVEVEVESVDVATVLVRMETVRTRVNIVILDACRDNPFEHRFKPSVRGLASIDAPAGTLIAYATAPGKVARGGAWDSAAVNVRTMRRGAADPTTHDNMTGFRCARSAS